MLTKLRTLYTLYIFGVILNSRLLYNSVFFHLLLLYTAGARYISISSYQASRDDELSFVRGAVVKVLKKYIDGWWLVRYANAGSVHLETSCS